MAPRRPPRRKLQPRERGKPSTDEERLPSIPASVALDLICPLVVLNIANFGFQPDASDILWRSQTHISSGAHGRISIGHVPKIQLNPLYTDLSGRRSRYSGPTELAVFKSPLFELPSPEDSTNRTVGNASQRDGPETIPFKDAMTELTLLSMPQLLYHNNVVDILGCVWEPHGKRLATAVPAPTLIMEFAEQGSLRSFYSSNQTVAFNTRIEICVDICHALVALHHKLNIAGHGLGIFHGDIKPDNVLIFPKRKGWFDWFWALLGYPRKPDFSAKLGDLGSSVRYDPQKLISLRDANLGTKGWKAPELRLGFPQSAGATLDTQTNPLKAEIFSFGLLVAYIVLGKDLFTIPSIDRYLAEEYFARKTPDTVDIGSHSKRPSLGDLLAAQQWMICEHLNELRDFVCEAVQQLNAPPEMKQKVNNFLKASLQLEAEDRLPDFKEACSYLGGDPEQLRARTPRIRVPDFIETTKSVAKMTQEAVLLLPSLTTMPHSFRHWLETHLMTVSNHVQGSEYVDKNQIIGLVALMRGLLSFVPPRDTNSGMVGVSHLRLAVDSGLNCAATIYARLASFIGSQDILDEAALSSLQLDACLGSVFAQEDLLESQTLTSSGQDMIKMPVLDISTDPEKYTLHYAAFLGENEVMDQLLARQATNYELEAQCDRGADHITRNFLNYAPQQSGTPLMWCVAMNNIAAAKMLVAKGASPFTENLSGTSPWTFAVANRMVPFVEIFAPCLGPDLIKTKQAKMGLLTPSLPVYISGGGNFVRNSLKVFRLLWDQNILTRQEAYVSAVGLGAASPDLLEQLLRMDYRQSPDMDLLHQIIHPAIVFGDHECVRLLLEEIPPLEADSFTLSLLRDAICSDRRGSSEVVALLLDHTGPKFEINSRFTHQGSTGQVPKLTLVSDGGYTLLHMAFSRGRISKAIELLRHGADPNVVSSPADGSGSGAGMTPLGHLLFPHSHHNYLALYEFLQSDYVNAEYPTFILDHAVLEPRRNYNIFHHLTEGEHERVHNNSGLKIELLHQILQHCRRIVQIYPEKKPAFQHFLNARLRDGEEDTMAPMHIAASNGFSMALRLLAQEGVKVWDRVGVDIAAGCPGFTPLDFVRMRSSELWEEEFMQKKRMLRAGGLPLFDLSGPIAVSLKEDYNRRTQECEEELEKLQRN